VVNIPLKFHVDNKVRITEITGCNVWKEMVSRYIGVLRQSLCSCDTLWTPGAALEGSACSVGGRKEPESPNLDDHVSDSAADVMMR
jgi:hypothetical protein